MPIKSLHRAFVLVHFRAVDPIRLGRTLSGRPVSDKVSDPAQPGCGLTSMWCPDGRLLSVHPPTFYYYFDYLPYFSSFYISLKLGVLHLLKSVSNYPKLCEEKIIYILNLIINIVN